MAKIKSAAYDIAGAAFNMAGPEIKAAFYALSFVALRLLDARLAAKRAGDGATYLSRGDKRKDQRQAALKPVVASELLITCRLWACATVAALKAELRQRGLSMQGRKADLVARLAIADVMALLAPPPAAPAVCTCATDYESCPVVLADAPPAVDSADPHDERLLLLADDDGMPQPDYVPPAAPILPHVAESRQRWASAVDEVRRIIGEERARAEVYDGERRPRDESRRVRQPRLMPKRMRRVAANLRSNLNVG